MLRDTQTNFWPFSQNNPGIPALRLVCQMLNSLCLGMFRPCVQWMMTYGLICSYLNRFLFTDRMSDQNLQETRCTSPSQLRVYHSPPLPCLCYLQQLLYHQDDAKPMTHNNISKKHKWLYSFWPALVSQAVYIYSYLAMCNDLFFKYHPHRIEKHSKLNRQIKSHAVINSEGRIEWHWYIIYWYSIATSYIGWVSTSSQHDSVDPYTDSNYDFGLVLLSLYYMTTMFNNDFITYRWRC